MLRPGVCFSPQRESKTGRAQGGVTTEPQMENCNRKWKNDAKMKNINFYGLQSRKSSFCKIVKFGMFWNVLCICFGYINIVV